MMNDSEIFNKLSYFSNLQDGWDSYGSPAPSNEVIEFLRSVINALLVSNHTINDISVGCDEVFFVYCDKFNLDVYFDLVIVLINDDVLDNREYYEFNSVEKLTQLLTELQL